MNIRHADDVRDFIRNNALPSFSPAIQWDETLPPFELDSPVIYCRQEGRPVDAFVRQMSVTVYLFSGLNATLAELNQLYTDAVAALEYVKANPKINEDIRISVSSDVSGEFFTGQNRRYYRFQLICYTN